MLSGTYLLGVVFSIIVFAMIVLKLRNSGMKEKYAIWWLLIGIVVLIISFFPAALTSLAHLLGVVVPLNLGFFLAGIVLLLISLQFSVDLSRSERQTRTLTEELALLKERVEQLEEAQ